LRPKIVDEASFNASDSDRTVFPSLECQAGVILVEVFVERDFLTPVCIIASDFLWKVGVSIE
jgi:hypothetical protein